jgi:hypothetical protein
MGVNRSNDLLGGVYDRRVGASDIENNRGGVVVRNHASSDFEESMVGF